MGRCIVLAFCTLSLDTRRCKSVVSSSVLSECLFLFAASCERQLAPHDPTLYRASEFSVQDYKKIHLQRGRCSVVRSTAKSSKGPNRADRLMRMVEEMPAQLEEEQTISEHQDSPANDKGPPIANFATSWSKPKIGPFQFSDHMAHMGKEDVTLTAKPMKAAFPKVVDHDETRGGGDVGGGAVAGAAEQGMGQMKLEAPPRFNGKRPRVREWLVDIRR